MAKRTAYLHIGLDHVASPAISAALAVYADELADRGVRAPARTTDETRRAALELRRLHRSHGLRRRDVEGSWADLCRRARKRASRTDVVVISEGLLAGADDDQIALLLDGLAGFEVHVVAVLVDPASQLVGAWTAAVRAGATLSLARYARRVLDPTRTLAESVDFWGEHDVDQVLARWSRGIGRADRVHVVVPDRDHPRASAAWRSLGELAGFDATTLDVEDLARTCLDVTGAAVLRGVNRALDGRIDPAARRAVLGPHLADREVEASGDQLPTLPADLHDELVELGEGWAKALAEGGYDVRGDTSALTPLAPSTSSEEVSPERRLASVTDALADLLVEVARLRSSYDELARRNAALAKKKRKLSERLAEVAG
ncbi:MAG: hypothetical protein F2667_02815 [Actinobacteria bacterium]|uniref:Unannotated protein n=1 Tax=freshwater metagenome TaxID=449393 RepID=A0A6J6P2Y3_9ZZZZ|nr:hypothetical protein [Actinomycetota bacterium]